MDNPRTPNSGSPGSLSLRPRAAAKALGIGERLLWDLTAPRGPIPCVRLGTCVLYPVLGLQEWLAAESAKSLQNGPKEDA